MKALFIVIIFISISLAQVVSCDTTGTVITVSMDVTSTMDIVNTMSTTEKELFKHYVDQGKFDKADIFINLMKKKHHVLTTYTEMYHKGVQ